MLDYKVLGHRIQTYRKAAGLTQSALADRLDVTNKYISQIECGSTEISLKRLCEVADVLGTKPEVLLSDTNPSDPNFLLPEISKLLGDLPISKRKLAVEVIKVIDQN